MLLVSLAVTGVAAAGGWVAAALRPSARARRKAGGAVRRVKKEERAVQAVEVGAAAALAAKSEAYAEHAREARLATLDPEDLKAYGAEKVRWGALRDAGVTSVLDVVHRRRADLEALDGVGEVSAQRIVAAGRKLLEASRAEPVPPPTVDDAARETAEWRGAARDLREVRRALGDAPLRLERTREELDRRLGTIKHDTRLHRELLGGAQGREASAAAVRDAAAIRDEVARMDAPGGLLADARAARDAARAALRHRPTADELAREHAAFFAEYTAIFEAALPGASSRRGGALGGLTDEIVARVEAFPLESRGLKLTLRPYQAFGAKYLLAQERTLLGDEMGLGKTVQSLAIFCHMRDTGEGARFLVVCPASVLHNWVREVTRWTSLDAHLLHGNERDARFRAWLESGGVAVTSFRTLQALPVEPEVFARDVDALVVDEAHFVKNPDAERTRAVAAVAAGARRVSFLSGTPLENRLMEFRRLVEILQPAVAAELTGPLSADGDLVLGRARFQQAVAPVYLRRNQEDVLRELPERVDNEEWVELLPAEQAAYRDAVAARNIMAMRRAATIGAGVRESAKLERLEELLDEYREAGRQVLVFSYFLDVLAALEERFRPHVVGTISGAVPAEERQQLADALAAKDGHAILLGQIQAAGVGMNLQSASVVVLLEPQWKPSTEEQAIARAHRMGQTMSVRVHRFYAADSVDERMKEVLADKQELFDTFARDSAIKDASGAAVQSLTKQVIEAEVERLGVELPPDRAGTAL